MAESHPIENWRPVVGYEGFYEVSDLGRVRSLTRQTCRGPRGGRMLRPGKDTHGYLMVRMCRDGFFGRRLVHRLVLESFVGPKPHGQQARHFPDRARTNNRLTNLAWGTPAENSADKRHHGSQRIGFRLNPDTVRAIRRMRACGENLLAIAAVFGVTESTVCKVLRGVHWSWVQD
jgi:hypothetical protein